MFPCDFEFDEETVRARALEVFQDDLFADGCLESYHSGALSLNELADKIAYLKSRSRNQAIRDLEELAQESRMEQEGLFGDSGVA